MTSRPDWYDLFEHSAEAESSYLQRDKLVDALIEDFGMSVADAKAELSRAIDKGWAIRRGDRLSLIAESATVEPAPEKCDNLLYPKGLRDRPKWLLWTSDKIPRAPWVKSDMYPCRWGGDLAAEERPETSFEQAAKWAQHEVIEYLPTNLDNIDIDEVELGFLLPPDVPPTGDVIVFVDLDAVRIPATGELHPRAREIVDNLASFTEISQSGTGLHLFVYGRLPERFTSFDSPIADDVFVTGSDKLPSIEMYQQAHWAAVTGRHLSGTPDDVHKAQGALDDIIDEFQPDERQAAQVLENKTGVSQHKSEPYSTTSSQSPYYSQSVSRVAQAAGANLRSMGRELRSDHPAHGGSNGTNFAVSSDDQLWRCYSSGHEGAGGNALHFVATVEGFLECGDCAGHRTLDKLTDEEFARLCLTARDTYGFSGSPPYRAVVGIARHFDLIEADREILGDIYPIARTLYDSTSNSELK